jgi:hypothetical protein
VLSQCFILSELVNKEIPGELKAYFAAETYYLIADYVCIIYVGYDLKI